MRRNWSAILVDAGIRDISVSDVARERQVDAGNVLSAARRYARLAIGCPSR